MSERIVVFGSFVVDLMSRNPHLPKPGETVKGSLFQMGPGGKGSNQAIAAKRSGADISFITKIGKDSFGEIAKKVFLQEKLDIDNVYEDDLKETGAALIMVDEKTSENKISVILGACENFLDEDIEKCGKTIKSASWLLTQLETNIDAMEKVVISASENGSKVILNPAPVQKISENIYKFIDIITPNEVEASILSGIEVNSPESAKLAAQFFMEKGIGNVVITLGSKGCFVKNREKEEYIPPFKVVAIDTTGAGDAFNGGLITSLSEGKNLFEAARFASAVAALSVTKIGTAPAMPYRNEIDKFLIASTKLK